MTQKTKRTLTRAELNKMKVEIMKRVKVIGEAKRERGEVGRTRKAR